MSRDNMHMPPGLNLDADAVCAQCGTVNPEATLICKVCGNNLRDQRSLRLQADQVLESAGEPVSETRWFAGALTVLGGLLIIFVAFFVNSIADFMVSGGVQASGASSLWASDDDAIFAEMRAELGIAPTPEDIAAAIEASLAVPEEGIEPAGPEGRYVLLPQNAGPDALPFGTAVIRARDLDFIFIAVLQDGSEVRGYASQRSEGLLTAEAARAAIKSDGMPEPVYGYAQRESDGAYAAWGQRQAVENEMLLGFVAYRLP